MVRNDTTRYKRLKEWINVHFGYPIAVDDWWLRGRRRINGWLPSLSGSELESPIHGKVTCVFEKLSDKKAGVKRATIFDEEIP